MTIRKILCFRCALPQICLGTNALSGMTARRRDSVAVKRILIVIVGCLDFGFQMFVNWFPQPVEPLTRTSDGWNVDSLDEHTSSPPDRQISKWNVFGHFCGRKPYERIVDPPKDHLTFRSNLQTVEYNRVKIYVESCLPLLPRALFAMPSKTPNVYMYTHMKATSSRSPRLC